MGSMGSGRSNFIDKLAELEGAKAPHGVVSRAGDMRDIAVNLYDHCEYVFVDTHGFNDSVRLAIQVLHTIADWLGRNNAVRDIRGRSTGNMNRAEQGRNTC